MYIVSITSQGQLSIPAPIRRKLGLNTHRRAIVYDDNRKMYVEPLMDFFELKGSLKTDKKPLSSSEIHEKFAEHLSEHVVGKKLRRVKRSRLLNSSKPAKLLYQ